MKTYRIISIISITVALLFSNCSDNSLIQSVDKPIAGTPKTIRISASLEKDGSRLGYGDKTSDGKTPLTWSEGDVLKVFNSTINKIVNFELVNGVGTAFGEFEGTIESTEGEKLHILYCGEDVSFTVNEDKNIVFDFQNQTGSTDGNFQLMYGEAVYSDDNLSVELEHLASVLKLTIPTDKTIKSVTLNHENIRSKATLVIGKSPENYKGESFKSGDLVYCYADDNDNPNASSGITIANEQGFTANEKEEVEVFFYVLATKYYNENYGWCSPTSMSPTFIVKDIENNEYVNSIGFQSHDLEKGKIYELHSGIFSLVKFDNEDKVNGVNDYYEISTYDQLKTLQYRVDNGLKNVHSTEYRECKYKLMNDIVLSESEPWTPIGFNKSFNGIFDGNGKKITCGVGFNNNVRFCGIFGHLSNYGEIHNLKVDDTFVQANPDRMNESLGVICGRTSEHSRIVNCINEANMNNGRSNEAGGIAGSVCDNSLIIACQNIGDINCTNYAGGISGRIYSSEWNEGDGAFIVACRNDGNIFSQGWSAGGIVGNIGDGNYNGTGTILGCWSSVSSISRENDDVKVGGIAGEMGGKLISNCYWKAIDGIEVAGYINNNENIVKCGSFASTLSNEQIESMNSVTIDYGYMFSSDGSITKTATTIPNIKIEDF